ncbi:MFS transporter [Mycolicibacterium litorale]|uniref:MFS transporter n=1 Tax=Mycolicibacterium litorale TaxID=758802 RepID=A0A6S6NX23_9MYCO|nr:MFS transporter [Mycolicibacterium litorale]
MRSVRSLRIRNYRLFFTGHSISVTGTWMQRVAQDWLVFEITDSPVAIGIALALQFGPILLLGIWGGVIADRVDRRTTLIVTQVIQLILALVLGVLAVASVIELWMVFLFALLLGLVTVVDQPVRQSFVANLVHRDSYANAQVLNSTAQNLGKFIGPAIAGAVIAWQDVGAAFLINALSFVAMLVALALMKRSELLPQPRLARGKGQAREGVVYVWRHPQLRIAMVLLVVVSVLGQNFRVVFPIIGAMFGGDAGAYGSLMAALGLGALVAALFTAARETATTGSLVVAAIGFGVLSTVLAGSPGLTFALVVTAGLGVTNFVFNTLVRTVMLLVSDAQMQGRVMALHGLVFLGSTPIGGLIIGWVCEQWGVRVGLLVGGVSVLLSAAGAIGMSRRASKVASGSPGRHVGADIAARPRNH